MRFIDLCAGIGGGKLGMEHNGLSCVAHAEIDPKPARSYGIMYGTTPADNWGDLMAIDTPSLPDAEWLIAGFPCQTFSIMGARAGFEDTRGTVIYGIIKILIEKQIQHFVLENVKGLVNHDGGRTLQVIREALSDAGYDVYFKVLNSVDFGVPQLRERIYLVGFRKDLGVDAFEFPTSSNAGIAYEDVLDAHNTNILPLSDATFRRYLNNAYNKGAYSVADVVGVEGRVIDTRQTDIRFYDRVFPTLRTGRHGLLYVRHGQMVKLNGLEALRLQGFPETVATRLVQSGVANGAVLAQAGNAMTVTVIQSIVAAMQDAVAQRRKKKRLSV